MKRILRLFPWRRQTVHSQEILNRYPRSADGRIILRLYLASPAALLMPFEGFPTSLSTDLGKGQDTPVLNLNKEFVEYLFARLAELDEQAIILRLVLPAAALEHSPLCSVTILHAAIQGYFAYLETVRRQNLQQLARDALLLGLLGVGSLGVSVFLESRSAEIDRGFALPLLNQGVTVFGWLTFWEALANALWNWRPLYQQLCMCQDLQEAQVEIEVA